MNSDANLRELQTNANKLIEDLRKNEPTEDIVRGIEEELRAVEQTRIEAVRVAEKLQCHYKTLQERQAALSLVMEGYSYEQQLRLQDAMQKQQQLYQILSSIMKVFQDTQDMIIQNLK